MKKKQLIKLMIVPVGIVLTGGCVAALATACHTQIKISGEDNINIVADSASCNFTYSANKKVEWSIDISEELIDFFSISSSGVVTITPNLDPQDYSFRVVATYEQSQYFKDINVHISPAVLTGLNITGSKNLNRYNFQSPNDVNIQMYNVEPIPTHASINLIH
jgi:hypothetical protein